MVVVHFKSKILAPETTGITYLNKLLTGHVYKTKVTKNISCRK